MTTKDENLALSDMARRLADAEMRLTFQEDSLQVLSDQLAFQQQLGDQLQRSLQMIYQQLRDRQDDTDQQNSASADEKPPHY